MTLIILTPRRFVFFYSVQKTHARPSLALVRAGSTDPPWSSHASFPPLPFGVKVASLEKSVSTHFTPSVIMAVSPSANPFSARPRGNHDPVHWRAAPVSGQRLQDARDKDHKVRLMFGNGMRPDVWCKFQERFGVKTVFKSCTMSEGNNIYSPSEGMKRCSLPYAVPLSDPTDKKESTHKVYIPKRSESD